MTSKPEKSFIAVRVTGSEIAQHTGLMTASVPGLIDRLENKGFVQQVRDHQGRHLGNPLFLSGNWRRW